MKATHQISQIITRFRESFEQEYHPSAEHLKVLNALEHCRTSTLGGHLYACPDCGSIKVCYNSCGNRHCPKCQGFEREKWVAARNADILPVKYFHVVFTLPGALHGFCLANKSLSYGRLFHAAWDTIQAFSRGYHLQPAMVSILHTWNAQLGYHPHLHCIVPAGGITQQGKWKAFPNAGNSSAFLFPVKAMAKVFRAKYISGLELPYTVRKELFKKDWVVYSKLPFCRVEKTVEYLGRYSHRVAITNRRIKEITSQEVTFQYKDRKDGGKIKNLTIGGQDFLDRFCCHILPMGFVRIRHYGFLASCNKHKLNQLQQEFELPLSPRKREKKKWKEVCEQITGQPYLQCPCCQKGNMELFQTLTPYNRGPPNILQINRKFYNNPA